MKLGYEVIGIIWGGEEIIIYIFKGDIMVRNMIFCGGLQVD